MHTTDSSTRASRTRRPLRSRVLVGAGLAVAVSAVGGAATLAGSPGEGGEGDPVIPVEFVEVAEVDLPDLLDVPELAEPPALLGAMLIATGLGLTCVVRGHQVRSRSAGSARR